MSDVENKPFGFKETRAWRLLNHLWNEMAEEMPKDPESDDPWWDDPSRVFGAILFDLLWLAQLKGADKEDIRQSLAPWGHFWLNHWDQAKAKQEATP
jgi:hypothetical protein